MAICVIALVGVAPCQCFSLGANQTTSPGRIFSIAPPQRCAHPRPQVTINVSSGPGQNPQETVPNVVGKRIPQALPALHAAGLRLIVLKARVSDKSQAGVIVLQTPLPGKQTPKNAQVLVYYGAYQG